MLRTFTISLIALVTHAIQLDDQSESTSQLQAFAQLSSQTDETTGSDLSTYLNGYFAGRISALESDIISLEEESAGFATKQNTDNVEKNRAEKIYVNDMESQFDQDFAQLEERIASKSEVTALGDSHATKTEVAEMEGRFSSDITTAESNHVSKAEVTDMQEDLSFLWEKATSSADFGSFKSSSEELGLVQLSSTDDISKEEQAFGAFVMTLAYKLEELEQKVKTLDEKSSEYATLKELDRMKQKHATNIRV